MDNRAHTDSTSALAGAAMGHLSNLARGEIDLARAELDKALRRVAVSVALLIGAVVLAIIALNLLAASAVAALVGMGLSVGWATAITGAAGFGLAAVVLACGLNTLKPSKLAPTRTTQSLRRDIHSLKGALFNG